MVLWPPHAQCGLCVHTETEYSDARKREGGRKSLLKYVVRFCIKEHCGRFAESRTYGTSLSSSYHSYVADYLIRQFVLTICFLVHVYNCNFIFMWKIKVFLNWMIIFLCVFLNVSKNTFSISDVFLLSCTWIFILFWGNNVKISKLLVISSCEMPRMSWSLRVQSRSFESQCFSNLSVL